MRIVTIGALTACCVQPQVITTVAGTDFPFPPTPIAASNAPTGQIASVAVDRAGNVYTACNIIGNNLVFKVDPQGILTVIAGNGTTGFSGDGGPATSAALLSPGGLAVDTTGNLFFVDSGNQRVRKVTPNGIISTVAGNGKAGFSGDGGLASNAEFSFGNYGGLAVDASGNLFIADQLNNRIREVTLDGRIRTVAGNVTSGYLGDGGEATKASLGINATTYVGIAVDASGNLFIADYLNNVIRKVTAGGTISTVAGIGKAGFSGDGGPATRAALDAPTSVAVDAAGNLFITDAFNVRVREVTPGGVIRTVVGSGMVGYAGDGGPATRAALSFLTGVAVDASDNLFIGDRDNNRIRKVTSAGVISTFVGNGEFRFAGDGRQATSAALYYPRGMAMDVSGNLYIADSYNNRIRKVTPGGIISTVAGNGTPAYSGDGGPATQAGLLYPSGVAVDASGNLFIADTDHDLVRKVSPDGIISTVAGSGRIGYAGDGGPAINAALYTPIGLATDGSGNLFIADNENNVIRKVTADGIISTVAGNGTAGFSGDGGPALKAALDSPTGIAVDASGNLFIADTGNDQIRKVTPGGTISTVAGNGILGYSGDGGTATSASLRLRLGDTVPDDQISVDAAGNLFIADYYNVRVRMVTPDGIITTVAGNGFYLEFGDGGLATNAGLYAPIAVLADSTGKLFISDDLSCRIRVVLNAAPPVSVSPEQLQFAASSGGAPTTPQTVSLTSAIDGLAFDATLPDGVNWLQLNPSSGASPRLVQVIADPTHLAPSSTPYRTTITIKTPLANPSSLSVPVTFMVGPGQPPILTIDKPNLSFPYSAQGSARSQTILVSNSGGGTLNFTAATSTVIPGTWLSVSPTSGQALPGSPATLTVTANPMGLPPGTYAGEVMVTAGSQTQSIPVTMTISTKNQAILLSQSGMSSLGVSKGGVIPPQSFGVLNIGTGVMDWKASITSTLPPGGTWLHLMPESGSTDAASDVVPTVAVSVDAAALAKGTYYGQVRVDAPGAANTPEVLTVVAQVLEPGSASAAMIQPAELLFTTTAGGESPGSQNLLVYNVAAAPKSFQASVAADPGLNMVILPTNATLNPQQPTQVVVQPFTSELAAGVYNAVITLQFSDGNVLSANVKVIIAAGSASSGSSGTEQDRELRDSAGDAVCTPTKLVLALNTLGQSYAVPAGYPVGLEVGVKDDCGGALSSGSVTASFSNGDPELQFQSLKNGLWNATWQTSSTSIGGVTVTLQANDALRKLEGKSVVNTALTAAVAQPVFTLQGIVSAAGGPSFVPVAPGSLISIRGTNLAGATMSATSSPLPIELVDTVVSMGGLPLRLSSVSAGQINAQVPFEIQPNATSYLLVARTSAYSFPVGVDVAPAQPAIYVDPTVAPNQGKIYVVHGDQMVEATPNSPAHPGDTIVISCAGLGAVSPAIADGAAAGANQLTTNAAQVSIGGQNAPVSFSGLTPGMVGIYQITAMVPMNAPTNNAVPVTIQIAGQVSPAVVIAIQ